MRTPRLIGSTTLIAALMLGGAACNRSQKAATDLQTSTAVQPQAQQITVTGCLRNGALADSTFVLTSDKPVGTTGSVWYAPGRESDREQQRHGSREPRERHGRNADSADEDGRGYPAPAGQQREADR
jgi:hypothetical protein